MTTRLTTTLGAFLLLCGGCAQNAILELQVDLPAADPARPNMVVQARSGEADFNDDWQQSQVTGIPLDTTGPNLVTVGIEGSGEDIPRELNVRLRFCEDPACGMLADGDPPEVWLAFERAFYQGEYTGYELSLPEVPTAPPATPLQVDKCEVSGCIEGSAAAGYCVDGVHHCE